MSGARPDPTQQAGERAAFEAALRDYAHACVRPDGSLTETRERHAAVLAIYEALLSERDAYRSEAGSHSDALETVAKQRAALRAERDAAVGQVAALRDALKRFEWAAAPERHHGTSAYPFEAIQAVLADTATVAREHDERVIVPLRAEVAALTAARDEAVEIVRELRRKLAMAGVEGSPPPGEDTTIGSLIGVKADLLAKVAALTADNERLRAACEEAMTTIEFYKSGVRSGVWSDVHAALKCALAPRKTEAKP